MGFVMLADLNAIGILASNFFLASYALMNLSCFHSDFTQSPRLKKYFTCHKYNLFHSSQIYSISSWRPAFKYYNKWVSLLSAFLCIGLMFGLSWIYATATVVCQVTYLLTNISLKDILETQAILGAYIYYRAPTTNWGSSAVSYTFNSAVTGAREVARVE